MKTARALDTRSGDELATRRAQGVGAIDLGVRGVELHALASWEPFGGWRCCRPYSDRD